MSEDTPPADSPRPDRPNKDYRPPRHSPKALLFLFAMCFLAPMICCGGASIALTCRTSPVIEDAPRIGAPPPEATPLPAGNPSSDESR